jgi:hypothetical protein
MKRGYLIRAVSLVGVVLTAAACSGISDQFSLTSEPPDEFRVVTRAPLAIPPDYILRPPEPGVARPQEGTATQQARTAVFRATDDSTPPLDQVSSNDERTLGERALLRAAGADQANPQIRQVVANESQKLNEEDGNLYDVLVFWRDDEAPGRVVDAEAEAKRLRENAALGRPATEGQTPTIERKKKALLEGIF